MTATEFKTTLLPAYGTLLRVARYILRNDDEAADVVQEVFRYLWENHAEIGISKSPLSFAVACVRNKCFDAVRKKRNVSLSEEVTEEFLETTGFNEDSYSSRLNLLYDAIQRMKEPSRTIVLMSLKSHKCSEIAREMNLNETNVRQILSRSRKQLREIVKETAKNYE